MLGIKNEKFNEDIYNEDEMAAMKAQSINPSNREALRDKIHEIHNYLRNNGAGYGMNALKVFNVLYCLKKIEENNLFDKADLIPECRFSYLLELANKHDYEELAKILYVNVLNFLNERKGLSKYIFYEIPKNMKGSTLAHIVKEIDSITKIEKTCNVLLSGKIYEYFIGRDESAISELGAYFTDRHIVEFIINRLDPKMTDGSIPTMIDMFGGSGGFTTGYINYLNEKYEKKINWDTQLEKVYHFDINEDVIKSAWLEFFCLTGVMPNENNVKNRNAFKDDFETKYKYIITNPPYGGDKNSKSEAQSKRDKIKEYIKSSLESCNEEKRLQRNKQLKEIELQEKAEKKQSEQSRVCLESCNKGISYYAKKYKLTGNDKESCSLILIMQLLDIGGTAIGVLKEGVFFNKTYKDLRKHLIENYNVREVISVPQDQFENTSTKTSILIFDNTEEKTTEVIFSELLIERYTEDKFGEIEDCIYIFENKGDVKQVNCIQVSKATKADILSNANISLNMKDYIKKEIIVGEGYELVRLGDICEIKNGKQLDKSEIIKGPFPVYGGGVSPIGFHSNYNNENSTIVAGTGNCGFVQFEKNKFWASQCFTIKSEKDLINKYLFIICKCMENTFKNSCSGSVQKFIRASQFHNLQIPIPKSPLKMKEWVDKISTPYNERLSKQDEIKKLEAFVQDRIKEIELKEECEEVELGSVCEILPGVKHCTNISKNTGKYKFYNSSQDSNLFVDFCEIKKESIIIGQGGNINIHYDKYFTPSKHVSVLQSIKSDYNELKYCYRFIKNSLSSFITNGSTINWLNKENIKKFKILLPKNKQLIQDLEPTFQRIEILQDEVKASDTLYKNLIRELSLEALPQQSEVISYIESKESDIQETESKETESHTESQPEPQTEPIIPTSSTTGCPYIPSRGKNKGIPCGIKSKNGNLYCRTHNKLSSSSDS